MHSVTIKTIKKWNNPSFKCFNLLKQQCYADVSVVHGRILDPGCGIACRERLTYIFRFAFQTQFLPKLYSPELSHWTFTARSSDCSLSGFSAFWCFCCRWVRPQHYRVGSVCGLVCEGRWCWPVRWYFIHVGCSHFVIAVELCNVFHVPQNTISQMVQRVCTNVTVEQKGWPVWM